MHFLFVHSFTLLIKSSLFFLILPHLPKENFFFRGIYLCRDFILLTFSKIWCTALFRFLYLWRSTSQRRLIPFNMTVLFVYKFIQFLKQKENMPIFSEIVALLMNSSYRENLQNVSVYTFLFKCLGHFCLHHVAWYNSYTCIIHIFKEDHIIITENLLLLLIQGPQ